MNCKLSHERFPKIFLNLSSHKYISTVKMSNPDASEPFQGLPDEGSGCEGNRNALWKEDEKQAAFESPSGNYRIPE